MSTKKKPTRKQDRQRGRKQEPPTGEQPSKSVRVDVKCIGGFEKEITLSQSSMGDPPPKQQQRFTLQSQLPSEAPSMPAKPTACFDRQYIPERKEAREFRKSMLACHDAGSDPEAYAEALLRQEARHERDELLRTVFGDMGSDSFLLRWAAGAHAGDKEALKDWQELAGSAVLHLREDDILLKMHTALEKVTRVLNEQSVVERTRLIASLFVLKCREKTGHRPTKAAVRDFLDEQNIRRPPDNKLSRLWTGPILGRLNDRRAGRPKKDRKPRRKT